jgi:hypothetical protein
MISNAIRVTAVPELDDRDASNGRAPLPEPAAWRAIDAVGLDWTVEKSSTTTATIVRTPPWMTLRFHLGPGQPSGQYAAMAARLSMADGIDRIEFIGHADRPRRISVQVRVGPQHERWRHSIYLDETPRRISIRIQDFEPADRPLTTLRPNVVPLSSLLVVVDTVNSRPGTEGEIAISEVRFGVGQAGN